MFAYGYLKSPRHKNSKHAKPIPEPHSRLLPSQVASLEDTDGLPAAGATSTGEDGSTQADGLGLAGGAGVAGGGASSGGGVGGSRAGWAKAEQVLGQRMERVATAWLEAIDQVRGYLWVFVRSWSSCSVCVLVLVLVGCVFLVRY